MEKSASDWIGFVQKEVLSAAHASPGFVSFVGVFFVLISLQGIADQLEENRKDGCGVATCVWARVIAA